MKVAGTEDVVCNSKLHVMCFWKLEAWFLHTPQTERLELSVNHFGCTPCNLAHTKDGPWGLEALATSHKGILYGEGPQPTTLQ